VLNYRIEPKHAALSLCLWPTYVAKPPRGYFHENANGEIAMHEVKTLQDYLG